MASDAKRQLVEFLIERAFDPVMKARPEGRSDAERKKLKDVQDATRAEIERFQRYGSAKDVVKNFKRDLNSGQETACRPEGAEPSDAQRNQG